MDDFDSLFEVVSQPPEYYAQVIITVLDHAPLLAAPRLARVTMRALRDCAPDAPGTLWGYLVLPDAVRLVVGPTGETALDAFITQIKAHTTHQLLAHICRTDDESLDWVLRYNPVWGGVNYQVWQVGSHRAIFWTEYKLSNALYDLWQVPVDAGLVEAAEAWPYRYSSSDGSV